MHWSVLLFAGFALILAHILRLPARGKWIGSGATFLIGLVGTAMVIKLVAGAVGMGRTTEYDSFVNRAIEVVKQDDAPYMVFIGASFSRNALDDERLTLALRERGYNFRAISLSIEAASLLERDAHLKDFLSRAPRPPEIVFVEVSENFDKRPTFFFNNSKFSARGIEQFTIPVTLKTLQGLADGGCRSVKDCGIKLALLGSHTGVNFLNVGLLSQGDITANVKPAPAYSGLTKPREDMHTDAVITGLATVPNVEPLHGWSWIKSERTTQRDRLLNQDGVRAVAYYYPPVTEPSVRAYASGLCLGELAGYTCIIGDDPELLKQLPPKVWADPGHLLDQGAAIYINWLADELIASGILDGALALRGSLSLEAAH